MTDEHIDDAYQLEEQQEVTVTTSDGVTVSATVTDKTRTNDPDPESVVTQRTWTLDADDGEEYAFGRIDGLARVPDAKDAFPSHIQLYRCVEERRAMVPEEDQHGYIVEVEVAE